MNLNKYKYKILKEPQKIYCSQSLEKLESRLKKELPQSIQEDEMTGILGKKLKRGNMYKIKYIHSRNNQLQPRTYERYYLLAETGEDENGVFLECVQVHDRLFEPIVKIAYIFTAALIIACLFFLVHRKSLDKASAYTISAVAAASVLLLFKKTNESADCCEKAEKVLKKYFSDI